MTIRPLTSSRVCHAPSLLSALVALTAAMLVVPATSIAATTVTGDAIPSAPLVIEPDAGGRIDDTFQMLFFIARMPTTKTINQVTLGDLAKNVDCPVENPWYTLTIYEHPTEAIGSWTPITSWKAESLEFANFDSVLQKRTWRVPPVTLLKGRGYSFWVSGYFSACRTAMVRSWAHNGSKVNAGPNRCDRVTQSAFRMWHTGGESDAVACGSYDAVPNDFDSSMPNGWLSVFSYGYPNNFVEVLRDSGTTVPTSCRGYGFGARAVYWRPWSGHPGWHEYVCVWGAASQFPDYTDPASPFYPNDPPDGWYYGFGWTSITPGDPRDLYVKLDLDEGELAKTFRPNFLFDDDEHYRPLDVRKFFEESYPAGSYSTHHRVCSADSSICEEIASADFLGSYPSDWYVDVTSYASDPDEEDEEDYKTPGCPQGGTLRDCNGGSTNAVYYEVNRPSTNDGYTFIDYSLFYRFDDKNDATNQDHEADLEGMTVAPSRTHPGTFDFASFAQHGNWWGYLRENLECLETTDDTCPGEPAKSGTRISAYVATGTHASYPDRCVNHFPGECGKNGEDFPRYEADHDGAAPAWPANNDGSTLKRWDNAWWYWGGRWGEQRTVESPGWRKHGIVPRDNQCARDNDGCLTNVIGSRVRRAAQVSAMRARVRRLSRCAPWFGPSVAALACSRGGLSRAIRHQALGRSGRFVLSVDRPRPPGAARRAQRAASAPSLSQYIGTPLRPGTQVRIRGEIVRGTTVLLRLRAGRRLYEAAVTLRKGEATAIRILRRARRPAILVTRGEAASVNIRTTAMLSRKARTKAATGG